MTVSSSPIHREKLHSKCVRAIDSALAAVPPQAHMATLAHIKVPEPGTEYAAEARGLLGQVRVIAGYSVYTVLLHARVCVPTLCHQGPIIQYCRYWTCSNIS